MEVPKLEPIVQYKQKVSVKCSIHKNKTHKNTNHQQMHKVNFIINCNTLLHVSTLLGHLQGELFVIFTLRLHFIVEWDELLTVYCVLEAWTLCGPALHCPAVQAGTTENSRLQKQRSTQSTAHSHSTIKCNLSVTIIKSSPWRWPSRVETCRSVLQLMIKLSLCICWLLVFLYNTVHGHGTHSKNKTCLSTKKCNEYRNCWHKHRQAQVYIQKCHTCYP
jgi:hypothetical protein